MRTDMVAEQTRDFLVGSLALSAAVFGDAPLRANRALRWYRRVADSGLVGLPLCLVHDVGWLLLEGEAFPFRSLRETRSSDTALAELRLLYEGRWLSGLLSDPAVRRVRFALSRDPRNDDACGRAVELLLRSLRAPDGSPIPSLAEPFGTTGQPGLDPATLRETRLSRAPDPEAALRRWEERAGTPGLMADLLHRCLGALVESAARGPLLEAEDLLELENWSVFARASQRLLARRLQLVSRRIGAYDPRSFSEREEVEEVETELPDLGTYPEGGFAELSNRGTFESLLPSELIFLDEPLEPGSPVDLFTLRHLEGELLYFMRESGQRRRRRRNVVIFVDASWRARLCPEGISETLAVLGYGLALRLAEDLRGVFSASSVKVHLVVFASEEQDLPRAREDRDLLALLLRDEVARGLATVRTAPAIDPSDFAERGSSLEIVIVGPGADSAEICDSHEPARVPLVTAEQASEDALREARDRVLAQLTGAVAEPEGRGYGPSH